MAAQRPPPAARPGDRAAAAGPRPGTTLVLSEDEKAVNSWGHVSGTSFDVRMGPDYEVNKKKAASLESLYDCVAVDFFHSDEKQANVAALMRPESGAATDEEELGMPSNFVCCINLPSYAPPNPLWGAAKEDGDGFCLVVHFSLAERTRAMLRGDSGDALAPAVQLIRAFVNSQPQSQLRQRFKAIARVVNLPEVQINGMAKKLVASYNATPFMIRTTSTFHRGPNYFEVDVDVHRFSYLALVGLNGVKEKISSIIADLAFVIQAESDREMPEQILGSVQLRRLQLSTAPDYPKGK